MRFYFLAAAPPDAFDTPDADAVVAKRARIQSLRV
jgi:hypothetical protein